MTRPSLRGTGGVPVLFGLVAGLSACGGGTSSAAASTAEAGSAAAVPLRGLGSWRTRSRRCGAASPATGRSSAAEGIA